MFHGPVGEVWQGLHTQINLSGAAKRGAQETGGKSPPGAYKGTMCKAMCSGAVEGHVLSPAVSFQQTRSERARRDLPPAAPLCNLLGSGPAVTVGSSHEERPMAAECPHGQDLATSHKILWNCWKEKGGRRKRGIIPPPLCCAGPQLSAGCRHWGSGTVAFQGLWPWFRQGCTPSTACPPHPPPRKNRESSAQEQVGKEDDPAANTPSEDACPQLCLRILLETPIHHSYAGHASLYRPFPAAAQKLGTN